jgi:hypothetical protein
VLVAIATKTRIERTTSGKPRRRAMWRELVTGASPLDLTWDSAAAEQGHALSPA